MLERKINEMFGDETHRVWHRLVERGSVGLLRAARVRGGGVPAFPATVVVSGAAPPLSMPLIRMLIQAVIVAAIVLGVISAFLREKKVLGLTGLLFALAATLLGGASFDLRDASRWPAIGRIGSCSTCCL